MKRQRKDVLIMFIACALLTLMVLGGSMYIQWQQATIDSPINSPKFSDCAELDSKRGHVSIQEYEELSSSCAMEMKYSQ